MLLRSIPLLLLAGLSPTLAQPPGEPPVVSEQISVSEVLLDVVATGRDGRVVLGLGPEDFRVEIGGREIRALAATFSSNRRFLGDAATARSMGIDGADPGQGRTFVLFFHDQRDVSSEGFSFVGQQLEAGRRAAEWLDSGLAPGDRAAVVAFDSRLRVYEDFTEDHEALRRAVLAASTGSAPPDEWPSRRQVPDPARSLADGLPAGTELRDRTPQVYEALQLVADAIAPIRGRKNLILFSRGIGELGAFGDYRQDIRYYPPTREALNAANVAVYGVNTGPQPGLAVLDGLGELAADTGGELYRQFVNYVTPLSRIGVGTNGYYLLALPAPPEAEPGTYLEATVRCRNPELRCSSRRGFRVAKR